jgi:thioredoxin-related protein
MRRSTVFLVLPFLLAACASAEITEVPQAGPPSAETLMDMARRTASVDDRVVLVKFRASWCEWCARLDEALHSFELGRLIADNYVLLDMTVEESDDKLALETPGGEDLRAAMGGAGSGIPYYVFFDVNGEKLADSNVMPDGGNIGYPVTPEEIAAFDGLLEQTAPRMTPEDREQVSAYLEAHAP